MAEPNIIRIADVRSYVLRALDQTEAFLGPEVAINHDYYWHVPSDELFDLDREPSSLTMGQLSDDLEELADHDEDLGPVAVWHQWDHLVGVLRALGEARR